MSITVKYHHGDLEYRRIGGSAAQVEQVLKVIQADLVARCGHYTWMLDGEPGNYRIIARYNKGAFIESRGKTPGAALNAFYPARDILAAKYGVAPY